MGWDSSPFTVSFDVWLLYLGGKTALLKGPAITVDTDQSPRTLLIEGDAAKGQPEMLVEFAISSEWAKAVELQ